TLLRWCGRQDVVLSFSSSGRHYPEMEHTLGPFGHPLFLRIKPLETDTFSDLLQRVIQEYGSAHEHDDFCRLPVQVPEPAFVWNPNFNWFPAQYNMNPGGYAHQYEFEDTLRVEQRRFALTPRHDMDWKTEPQLQLSDTPAGVMGTIKCRSDRIALVALQ